MISAASLASRTFYAKRNYHAASSFLCRSHHILHRKPNLATDFLHFSSETLSFSHCKRFEPHTSHIRVESFDGIAQTEREENTDHNLDTTLPIAETFCLVFSSVVFLVVVIISIVSGWKSAVVCLLAALQFVGFLGALIAGAWIRRRQWRRFDSAHSGIDAPHVNLAHRVDKLDVAIRNSTTLVKMLSRQLEKLGIRFRVTRKSLRRPMDEIAALEQKNSEAVRSLTFKVRTLEDELREIQKVLLAMQEHQRKQLELILTIGKNQKF